MKQLVETFFAIAHSNPEAYRHPATYDRVVNSLYGRQKVAGDLADLFIREIPVASNRPPAILDLACGTGILSLALAKRGYKVIAADLEIKATQALIKKNTHNLDVSTLALDINHVFPIASARVDGVAVLSANRYIHDKGYFASEVARVLKPGGVLIWPAGIFGVLLHGFGAILEPFASVNEIKETIIGSGLEILRVDSWQSIRRNLLRGVPFYSVPTYVLGRKTTS